MYLGSPGPHHTLMPAMAQATPFPLHAQSEYMKSTVVFLGAAILRGLIGFGAGVVTALNVDRGDDFETATVDGIDGV